MLKCSDTSALAIQHQQECVEVSSHAVWALVVVQEDTVRMATLDMVDTDHNHAAALKEGRVAHEAEDSPEVRVRDSPKVVAEDSLEVAGDTP